jgi:uncharacterized membrane protein HdeD (DUF308 family)
LTKYDIRKEDIMTEFADEVKAGIKGGVKAGGNRMRIFGVIAVILGILCLLAPGLTGTSALTLMGLFVLAAGIVRMIWAFLAGSFGKGLLLFSIGGLTLLCGIALVANPLFVSGVLTVMLAVYFIFDGISEIVGGIRLRPESGWGWMLFGGIVSVLLGIMIWAQFPLSGVWAIGILLGIKLFFVGLIMFMGGSAVRSMANRLGKGPS